MSSGVDACVNFDQLQVNQMRELLDINDKLKVLETRKKVLVEDIKNNMNKKGINHVTFNRHSLKVTESMRRTVISKTKDTFVSKLLALGKNYLVTTEIKPDVDSIFAEVDAGTLDKDLVEQYIKSTPVFTLRCD